MSWEKTYISSLWFSPIFYFPVKGDGYLHSSLTPWSWISCWNIHWCMIRYLVIKGFDAMIRLPVSCSGLAKDHKSVSVRRIGTRTVQKWHSNELYFVWWPRKRDTPQQVPELVLQYTNDLHTGKPGLLFSLFDAKKKQPLLHGIYMAVTQSVQQSYIIFVVLAPQD